MANTDTVMSDSSVKIVDKSELDKITRELQGAVSSAAFMGAAQGAEKRADALDATVRGMVQSWYQYVRDNPEQEIFLTQRAAIEFARFVLPDVIKIRHAREIKEMIGSESIERFSLADGFVEVIKQVNTLGEFAVANRETSGGRPRSPYGDPRGTER